MPKQKFLKLISTALITAFLTTNILAQTISSPNPFSDVTTQTPYYSEITNLYNNGIIKGYADGTFKPTQNINRAEFLKILIESHTPKTDIKFDPNHTFSDIDKTQWYAKYISTAKRLKIISGYPDGTFKPANNINLAEALKISFKTFNLNNDYESQEFPEFEDQWFNDYLNLALVNNIFDKATLSSPSALISRAQSANLIYQSSTSLSRSTTPNIDTPFINPTNYQSLLYYKPFTKINLLVNFNKLTEITLNIHEINPKKLQENIDKTQNLNELKKSFPITKTITLPIKEITNSNPDFYSYYKLGYIELPISTKGLYLIDFKLAESPNDYYNTTKLINITDLTYGILANSENQTNNLIWLNNSKTNQPISNAQITAYHLKNNSLTSSKATPDSKEGLYKFTLQNEYNILTVKTEDDFLITRDSIYNNQSPYDHTLKAFTFTDRNLYAPGETVYFKSIFRNVNSNSIEIPAPNQFQIKLTNYNYETGSEQTIYETTLTLNTDGEITKNFQLPIDIKPGYYSLNIINKSNNQTIYGSSIQVENFIKNDFELILTPSKPYYISNDTAEITLTAKTLSGTALANKIINYEISKSNYYFPPCRSEICPLYSEPSIDFKIMPYPENQIIKSGKLTLDESGKAQITFKIDPTNFSNSNYNDSINYQISANFLADNNQITSNQTSISAYKTDLQLSAQSSNYFTKLKQPHTTTITATNLSNSAISNQPITAIIFRNYYKLTKSQTSIDPISGTTYPNNNYEFIQEKVETQRLTTDNQGKATLTYTPTQYGDYEIIFETKINNTTIQTSSHFHTNSDPYQYYYQNYLNVLSDKPEYKQGETINLTLETAEKITQAIAIIPGKSTNEFKPITFNHDTSTNLSQATFTYPTTTSTNTNLQIIFFALNNQGDVLQNNYSTFLEPQNKLLNIYIKPSKSTYTPGETAKLDFNIQDQNSQPIPDTTLTVFVVDKGLLNLTQNYYPTDIYRFFYTFNSFSHLLYTSSYEKLNNSIADEGSRTSTEKSAPTMEEQSASSSNAFNLSQSTPRTNFANLAIWKDQITTDKSGKATIQFKLPDNETQWQVFTFAHNKNHQFGEKTTTFKTNKEISIISYHPKFLTQNDKFEYRIGIKNTTSTSQTLNLSINQSSNFQTPNPTQQITVEPNQIKTATFQVNTLNQKNLTSIPFTITAKTTSGQTVDAITQEIPFQPRGRQQLSNYSGIDSSIIPIKTIGNQSNLQYLKISLSPTQTDRILTALEFLNDYPYGCTEQTMSKLLPLITIHQNRNNLKLESSLALKDIDKKIQTGLDRLTSLQHTDGGWGFWENDESTAKNTAYVYYGLSQIARSDLPKTLKLQAESLRKPAETKLLSYLNSTDKNLEKTKPYIIYVLSNQITDQTKLISELKTQSNLTQPQLINYSYLALSALRLNQTDLANNLLTKVKSNLTTEGQFTYQSEPNLDYELINSNLLSTALALEVLTTFDSTDTTIPKIINYLNRENLGNNYFDTHALSHAVTSIANYVAKTGELTSTPNFQILLNNKEISSGQLLSNTQIFIPNSKLNSNSNTIEIKKTGSGKIYFSIEQSEYITGNLEVINNKGITLTRTYLDQNDKPIENLTTGQTIKVKLTLTANRNLSNLLIKDFFPAGLQPQNPNLTNQSSSTPYFRTYQNAEIHKNHIAFFLNRLNQGETTTYTYTAQVTTPGTFSANPATAHMMYASEIHGATDHNLISIN